MDLEIQSLLNDLSEHSQTCSLQATEFNEELQNLSLQWADAAGARFHQLNATDSIEVAEKFLQGSTAYFSPCKEFVGQAINIAECAAKQDEDNELVTMGHIECDDVARLIMQFHTDASQAQARAQIQQQEMEELLRQVM